MFDAGHIQRAVAAVVAFERMLTASVSPAELPQAPVISPQGPATPVQIAQVPPNQSSDVFGGVRRAPPVVLSAEARQFNTTPTMTNLLRLAEASPAEARGVVSSVLRALKNTSIPTEVDQSLKSIVATDDSRLAAAMRESRVLRVMFPDDARDFQSAVASLASTRLPGWQTTEVPQTAVTGIARSGGQGRVTLDANGRTFELVTSPRLSAISPSMGSGWIEGFLYDGDLPITVQGTVSADGKQLLVEGFMPGTGDDFVFGRVQVILPNGQQLEPFGNPPSKEVREQVVRAGVVQVATARGPVVVTDPELKAQLAHLPRLGVILPVATSEQGGRQVIDQSVPRYYALGGRFESSPSQPAEDRGNGTYASRGAAAYDNYKGLFVIEGGSGVKDRMENNGGQRNFPFGSFVQNRNGDLVEFRGTYVSRELGQYTLPQPVGGEGNAVQTLLAGSEAVVRIPNDFVRSVPPADSMRR
jgi:hypothetical protein